MLNHDSIYVNTRDEMGRTPLLIASEYGHTEIVNLFEENVEERKRKRVLVEKIKEAKEKYKGKAYPLLFVLYLIPAPRFGKAKDLHEKI